MLLISTLSLALFAVVQAVKLGVNEITLFSNGYVGKHPQLSCDNCFDEYEPETATCTKNSFSEFWNCEVKYGIWNLKPIDVNIQYSDK